MFNVEEVVEYEANLCMGCRNTGSLINCVACRAEELGCSNKATAIFLTRDQNGNILDIHRVWIH